MRTLSPKAVVTNFPGTVSAVVGFVFFIIFVMIGGRISTEANDVTVWVLLLIFLFVGLLATYALLWLHLFRYQLGEDKMEIERGVITKSYDSIPYSRIQNVGIERSFAERALGISTVDIQTAGSGYGSAEGRLPGVEKRVAEDLREELMGKT